MRKISLRFRPHSLFRLTPQRVAFRWPPLRAVPHPDGSFDVGMGAHYAVSTDTLLNSIRWIDEHAAEVVSDDY